MEDKITPLVNSRPQFLFVIYLCANAPHPQRILFWSIHASKMVQNETDCDPNITPVKPVLRGCTLLKAALHFILIPVTTNHLSSEVIYMPTEVVFKDGFDCSWYYCVIGLMVAYTCIEQSVSSWYAVYLLLQKQRAASVRNLLRFDAIS